MDHYDAKDCNRDETRRARDGVVHSRCGPSAVLPDRAHNGRGQRRYRDCHAQSQNNRWRKKICPVIAANSRQQEKQITNGCNDGPNDKWKLWTVTRNKSAGPTRKERHDQYERQQRRASGSRWVPLNLNEIQREEKECSPECSIEQ